MFKIFKAEVPAARNHTKSKYGIHNLRAGQAFTVEADHDAALRNAYGGTKIQSAVSNWQRRHGGKYVTRRNTDDSITVYCVKFGKG